MKTNSVSYSVYQALRNGDVPPASISSLLTGDPIAPWRILVVQCPVPSTLIRTD
jgi:hypothetical protein